MEGIVTEQVRFATSASPCEVWEVLTTDTTDSGFLYGLQADSGWLAGDHIAWTGPFGHGVEGEVLLAEAPSRLSFTLGDGQADTAVYVTWEIQGDEEGSVVRLYVDETRAGNTPADQDERETVWLPVTARLAGVLQDRAGRGCP